MAQSRQKKVKAQAAIEGPKPITYGFFLFLARILMKILYGIRFDRDKQLKATQGPYFIVGNHISYLDPIIAALAIPDQPIRFVSGQEIARSRFLRPLLKRVGIIEIQPFRVNFSTTKEIIGSIAHGHSVALYPETQRSMAGGLTPFGLATAKLIKHLKVSVAAVVCHGAYLGWPRWAPRLRPGKMEVSTHLLLTGQEAASLSIDDIQRRLVQMVDTDDYDWQTRRKRPARFISGRRAEKLSSVCHWCPVCDRPLVMRSEKHKLFCPACQLSLRVDAAGFFSASPGSPAPFDHPLEYARWQRLRLMEALEAGQSFMSDCRLEFLEHVGTGTGPDRPDRKGRLQLSKQGLSFFDDQEEGAWALELGDTPSLYCSPGLFANLQDKETVWRAWPQEEGYVALLTDYSRQVWVRDHDFDRYLTKS